MTENTIQRIKMYIDFKGIRISSLEKNTGMSNGSFASQLKNKRTIGVDKLENILKKYLDINPEWLLTGRGEMLRKEEKAIVTIEEEGIVLENYYKELAGARQEIIIMLKEKIEILQKEIDEVKSNKIK
jgi:transcriptional regulator with XRE-family HTH domain